MQCVITQSVYPFPWKISWISNKLTIWSNKYAETNLSLDVVYTCRYVLRTIGNSFSKAWLKEKYEPWGTDTVQLRASTPAYMLQCKSNACEMRKFCFLFLSEYFEGNFHVVWAMFWWAIREISFVILTYIMISFGLRFCCCSLMTC